MSTKKGKTKKEVTVPILNDEYDVCVIWDATPKEVKNHWEKHFDEQHILPFFESLSQNNRGNFFSHPDHDPMIAIWLPSTSDEFYATLAHEASHAIEDICNKIEQHFGGEFASHSIGAIVRHVQKANANKK